MLRHRVAGDTLKFEFLTDFLLESGVGTEQYLPALDHLRRLELRVGEHILGIALAVERDLESAEVVEHHYLSLVEGFDDVLLHALEHCIAVRGGHGGGVVDALCELLKIELTSLHCGTFVVLCIGELWVAASCHFVSNRHNVNGASPNPLPKRGLPDIAERVGEGLF